MRNISTKSMGARLGKARTIYSQLLTFPDYAPDLEDLTLPKLKEFLDNVEAQNSETAAKIQECTNAVHLRHKTFRAETDSLHVFADQISAHVRYNFGRRSKEATSIHAMVTKIRGSGKTKKKKVDTKAAEAAKEGETTDIPPADPKTISRSERTFGNMAKTYTDIVATIVSYGSRYRGTGIFALDALNAKAEWYKEMNEKADMSRSVLRLTRQSRSETYRKLSTTMQQAQDAVRAQYGSKSQQYKIVKATKI